MYEKALMKTGHGADALGLMPSATTSQRCFRRARLSTPGLSTTGIPLTQFLLSR